MTYNLWVKIIKAELSPSIRLLKSQIVKFKPMPETGLITRLCAKLWVFTNKAKHTTYRNEKGEIPSPLQNNYKINN